MVILKTEWLHGLRLRAENGDGLSLSCFWVDILAKIPIFVLAGQSNAVILRNGEYLASALEERFTDFELASYAWGGTPLAARDPNPNATLVAERDGLDWSPYSTGELFDRLVSTISSTVNNVIETGNTPVLAGIVWSQGERDAYTLDDATSYSHNLVEFVQALRQQISSILPNNAIETPQFVMAELASRDYTYADIVAQQQKLAADSLVNTDISAVQSDWLRTDLRHYSNEGAALVADGLVDKLSRSIHNAGQTNTITAGTTSEEFIGSFLDVDVVSYADSTWRVVVNLGTAQGYKGYAQGDTFSQIDGIIGSQFSDILIASDNGDWLRGGRGHGKDQLIGGSSRDVLNGGAGDDILKGGGGADLLIGGVGIDILNGGAGNDIFEFRKASANDYIQDLEVNDFIRLRDLASSEDDLLFLDTEDGLQIDYGSGVITVENWTTSDVEDIQFWFV